MWEIMKGMLFDHCLGWVDGGESGVPQQRGFGGVEEHRLLLCCCSVGRGVAREQSDDQK